MLLGLYGAVQHRNASLGIIYLRLLSADPKDFRGFFIKTLRIFYHRLLGIPKDDKTFSGN